MKPRIEYRATRTLIGMCRKNVQGSDGSLELWQTFMPRRGEITARLNSDFISMRIFHRAKDEPLTPQTPFDEWAAAEVNSAADIPDGMEVCLLPDGDYAVFLHRGPASRVPRTMQYIFGAWLPPSDYALDTRPHLAVMGANYRPDDPEAEEEIWIPVFKPLPASERRDE